MARAMMSVPLPGVNGTMMRMGLDGHACAIAAPGARATARPSEIAPRILSNFMASSSSGDMSCETVAHRHVLWRQVEARSMRLLNDQGREIFLGHAVAHHALHQVARDRRERHRHFETLPGVETEVEVLPQEVRGERDFEVEVHE